MEDTSGLCVECDIKNSNNHIPACASFSSSESLKEPAQLSETDSERDEQLSFLEVREEGHSQVLMTGCKSGPGPGQAASVCEAQGPPPVVEVPAARSFKANYR